MQSNTRILRRLAGTVVAGAASIVMVGAQAPEPASVPDRGAEAQAAEPQQGAAPQSQPSQPSTPQQPQQRTDPQAEQPQTQQRQAAQGAQTTDVEGEAVEFIGTVVRPTFPTRPFELRLDRFSNEAERNHVIAVFKQDDDPKAIAEKLKEMEAIGSFRTISGWGNEIRYAEEVTAADGTRKLLLATDRQINYWDGANAPEPVTEAFTFIEVRFKDGEGVGRTTHGDFEVIVDPANLPAIENFDELQPELMGVKRVEEDSDATAAADTEKDEANVGAK